MLPLMLQLYTLRLGEAGAPLKPRIDSEIDTHLGYVDQSLKDRDFLLGDQLRAADVQMSFVGEVGRAFGRLADKPNLDGWVDRLHARPAYKRALEKGGPYAIGQ
jgi:glutathione S-transferase